MKKIPVKFAKIDDEDFERVSQYTWTLSDNYAHAWDGEKHISLHRFITNCPANMVVDHINHDGLDNRKENLRICTYSQNSMNVKKRKISTSKFKGVTKCSQTGKWRAQIHFNKTRKNLGRFITEVDAAKAYNKAALEIHGEFASLNEVQS